MITDILRICFCLLFLLLTSTSSAQGPTTVFLEELTWTELRDQIKAGKTTVIIPIGGTEQNGPHMALGKHNLRAKLLSEKIALKLGNAIVAPVIAYVPEGSIAPPTAHMRFPGTITVPDDTFQKTLEYAARSFRLHGFRDIVFLGDHGGYQKAEKSVADRLNREWLATPARAHAIAEYYLVTETAYAQALKQRGYKQEQIGTHAALADTSLMLALDPRMVRIDAIQSGSKPDRSDGTYGDPRQSNAEAGQLGVNLIVARTVEAIQNDVAQRKR